VDFGPNTLIVGAGLLGRKRGIFVLVTDEIVKDNSAMNTPAPSQAPQEITRSRRIGVLIYPGCDVLDVCGPCEAFHWADVWLPRFGRTGEPGYQCHIITATPGLVRTISGIEVAATHSYCDIGDGLDTLIVAGGVISGAGMQGSGARRMGALNGAAGAAGGVGLHWRVHIGGRGPLASPARDDALDVFRCPRDGIPLDRG
jgi:hypothetical protein